MSGTMEKPKIKFTGKQWGVIVTMILMFFFAPTFGAVSTTYGLMPDVFGVSNAAASWIGAIGNATSCIAGLCVGLFVGKKMSYRAGCIIACLVFTVFGALPFLWQGISWGALLASRAVFGLGVGMFNPICQAAVTHMIPEEGRRAAVIGFMNIAFGIGGAFGSTIVGALATDAWQTSYAFYLICVIPLILAIVFVRDRDIIPNASETPGADLQAAAEEAKAAAPAERRHIPGAAWAFIIIFLFSTICSQCFFNYTGVAMIMSGNSPLLIGTVFTIFTIASILIGFVNAPLWKTLRLWNFPSAFIVMAIGYILCIAGSMTGNIVFFYIAAALIGFGCCLGGMVMPMAMATFCTPAALSLAIGLQEIARNGGAFLSTPWMQAIGKIFGDMPVPQYTAVAVLCIVAGIAAIIVAAIYNKRFKNVEAINPMEQ